MARKPFVINSMIIIPTAIKKNMKPIIFFTYVHPKQSVYIIYVPARYLITLAEIIAFYVLIRYTV